MNKIKEYFDQTLGVNGGFWVREITSDEITPEPMKANCFIICLCTCGEATFSIDSKDYIVQAYTEVLLLPDMAMGIMKCSADFRVRMFIFSNEISEQSMMRLDSVFFNTVYENPTYRFPEGEERKTLAYFDILDAIQSDPLNSYRSVIAMNLLRAFCLDIYDKIKRYGNESLPESSSRKEEIYGKFMALLNANCRKRRDVAFYAGKLCISTRYLAAVTNYVSGESPKETIDFVLVQEIKMMLTFTELSVQEIAYRVSFPDQSYLGRYFKHHTGTSPTEYRRSLRDM